MADGIIGSVGVSVVPDAQDFWRRFEEQTRGGATEAGRKSGNAWQRGFQGAAGDTSVRVRADTTQARAQIAALKKETDSSGGAFQKLIRAAIALSPAIVPLGAAAAAAGSEFAALGASGLLAFKGMKDELHDLTPQGAQVSAMLSTLKGGLNELSRTAAKGALPGFSVAVAKLHGELPQLNSVIKEQSALLGDVAQHVTGGLVGGFRTFAPLLDQVGGSVDRVAARFEAWATGPGGAHFSKVLSSDYAQVAPIVDELAHSIAHIAAASHGVGLGILGELQLLSRVISAFPTPLLQGIIAGFVSFKTIQAVTGVNALSGAFQVFGARSAAAAAQSTAANLQIEASTAAAAAEVAAAQAAEAASVAASQAEIAAALEGTGSVLAASAAAAAEFSAEEAAAFQAAALAASASAAEIATAAETAAAASVVAGEEASIGWAAVLGPIGIVAGAVGLLGLSFLHSSKDTAGATAEIQRFTDALLKSNGAVTDGIRANVAKDLSQKGLIESAQKYGLTTKDLIDYTLGSAAAQDKVKAALQATLPSVNHLTDGHGNLSKAALKAHHDLVAFLPALDAEKDAFSTSADAARAQAAALGASATPLFRINQAAAEGSAAMVDFAAAANTFDSSAHGAADRATLLGAALKAANGDALSYAQAINATATANQQFVTDLKNVKDGVINLKTGTLDYHNAAAGPLIADLSQIQNANVQAAAAIYQHETALGKASAATDAFNVYQRNTRTELINEAEHLGYTAKQAKGLADQFFTIHNAGDLKKHIELLGGDKVTTFLKDILADLDILAGKTVTATVAVQTVHTTRKADGSGGAKFEATGGFISGPGSGTSDSIPAWLSNGEFVVNAKQTAKHRDMLHALNAGAQGFASGGEAGGYSGVDYSGTANKYGATKGGSADYIVAGQHYSTARAAANAAAHAFRAQVNLGLKIDGSDMAKFRASLKGTADQAHAAFVSMYNDAKKLGISDGLSKTLRVENAHLDKEINDRNKAAAKLKAVTEKFNAVRASVKDATSGAFDVTSAGTGFDGQQPVTFANLQAQETQAKNLVVKWAAGIKKLSATFGKSGTGKKMLQDLAERGPSDYPEVQALLTASPSQLAEFVHTDYEINKTGADLGTSVGNTLYGSQISDLKKEISIDNKTIDKLAAKMEKQLAKAVAPLYSRPIEIKLADGTVIARVGASGAKKNARRS